MPLQIDRDLPIDYLRSVVEYDRDSGIFIWRQRICSRTNPGDVVGNRNKHGYLTASINFVDRPLHRLAWAYVHGEFPSKSIDHINGCRDDNRIDNLRVANRREQAWNRKTRVDNDAGIKGVRYDEKTGMWMVRIHAFGVRTTVGRFSTVQEATAAYDMAAELVFGAFARLNGERHETNFSDDVVRSVGRLRKRIVTYTSNRSGGA